MNYNNEININLNDIKEYVHSTLIYLKTNNKKIDKDEIIMYLSSVDEIINNIKTDLINYLYFLKDKSDEVYQKEVFSSIDNFIADLSEVEDNE